MRKILLLLCIISITFSAKAQLFGKHWDKGSYYDTAGHKHIGLISWVAPQTSFLTGTGDEIYFKTDKTAEELKIKSDSLNSFLVETDTATYSYVVSKNKILEKKPILQILFDNTPKLYASLTTRKASGSMGSVGFGVSYLHSEYYFGDDHNSITKLDKKNFIEVMSKIMADKPETVERIKSKRLRIGDMDALLYFYKYGLMPPAPAPDPFSGPDH